MKEYNFIRDGNGQISDYFSPLFKSSTGDDADRPSYPDFSPLFKSSTGDDADCPSYPDFSPLFKQSTTQGEEQMAEPRKNKEKTHLSFEELPPEMQHDLTVNYYKQGYRADCEAFVSNIDHSNRLAEMERSAELNDIREEKAEERRMERESETLDCFIDTDGCVWARFKRPTKEGRKFRVIDRPGLKLTKYEAVTPAGDIAEAFQIDWDGDDKKIIIRSEDLTVEKLPEILAKKGLALKTTRRNHTAIVEKLLALLERNIIIREIPYGFGWRKNMQGNWGFIDTGTLTLTEVIKNV